MKKFAMIGLGMMFILIGMTGCRSNESYQCTYIYAPTNVIHRPPYHFYHEGRPETYNNPRFNERRSSRSITTSKPIDASRAPRFTHMVCPRCKFVLRDVEEHKCSSSCKK